MGFCLETEYYPDFPTRSDFASCFLKSGIEYERDYLYAKRKQYVGFRKIKSLKKEKATLCLK